MKQILLLACGLLMSFSAQAQSFENAKDAVKNMGVGWNLGNTLDANDASKTWTTTEQHETCWGQPVTKPELMKMMKEAGFNSIRVPVTWYQEMDSEGNVNEAWMNRVKEVVDYVIDNGMYCILNVHHDTGDGNTHWIHASSTNYNKNKAKFEKLWKQIAETFKDYDQHLLFEGYNEMLDDNNTWNEPSNKTDGYKAINNYAKSFVTTVRNSGGNNASRNLIVNTYSASSTPNAMQNLDKPENSNHIIFQIHSYPNWKSKSNAKTEIDNLISNIKSKLIDRAPVIIGEYATFTTWPSEIDYYATDKPVALYAMDYLIKETKKAGIGTCYWMGMSDGSYRDMPAFHQADLAQTLIKAYYGSIDGYKYPTSEDFDITYDITYNDEWSEAFLFGSWSRTAVNLSGYKGIRVVMDKAYGNKLQLKIYGDKKSGTNYNEQYVTLSEDSETTTAVFDTSILGSTFWGVTLQTNSGATTATLKEAKLIKADDTEESLSATAAWGCTVEAKSTPKPTGIHAIKYVKSEDDGAIYNLQGQRVDNPKKGIFIKAGKKVVF
jgi:aryl-phospho-beta-D-glucosidase BglC (GH1 family)